MQDSIILLCDLLWFILYQSRCLKVSWEDVELHKIYEKWRFLGISRKVLDTSDSVKICLWFPKLLLKLVCIWPFKDDNAFQSFAFWLIMADCAFIEYGLYNFISENFRDFNESFTAITFFSTIMQVPQEELFYCYHWLFFILGYGEGICILLLLELREGHFWCNYL